MGFSSSERVHVDIAYGTLAHASRLLGRSMSVSRRGWCAEALAIFAVGMHALGEVEAHALSVPRARRGAKFNKKLDLVRVAASRAEAAVHWCHGAVRRGELVGRGM